MGISVGYQLGAGSYIFVEIYLEYLGLVFVVRMKIRVQKFSRVVFYREDSDTDRCF